MTERPGLLVIDDEQQFAALIKTVADKMGFDAIAVSDAAGFKAAFARRVPEVICLDIVMPDVDGIELLSFLDEAGYRGRLILVSGRPEYIEAAKALAEARGSLSVRVLPKPIKLNELRAALAPAADA